MISGLYIHIPFCRKKCAYCDFYSVADLSLAEDFIGTLVREIAMRAKASDGQANQKIQSLYLGGGTPSALSASAIAGILETVDKYWKMTAGTEITCEINPGTVDRQYLSALKGAGVNRLSIGVQSLDDKELAFLGRIHDRNQAAATVELAWNAGFENLCADMIYGIRPGPDSRTALQDTLTAASAMPLTHLSCYMLTLEPGTPLYETRKQSPGRFIPEETKMDLFVQVSDFLKAQGFLHYEVSNFAKKSQYCSIHNQGYWNGTPYLGFGPSAHSFAITDDQRQVRFWNVKNLAEYIALVRGGQFPVEETENLTWEQQMTERIMLGLRTKKGLDLERFYQKFGRGFQPQMESLIKDMEAEAMGKKAGGAFFLNTRGWTYLDHITEIFVNTLQ